MLLQVMFLVEFGLVVDTIGLWKLYDTNQFFARTKKSGNMSKM